MTRNTDRLLTEVSMALNVNVDSRILTGVPDPFGSITLGPPGSGSVINFPPDPDPTPNPTYSSKYHVNTMKILSLVRIRIFIPKYLLSSVRTFISNVVVSKMFW
jgi:hypothetical protein